MRVMLDDRTVKGTVNMFMPLEVDRTRHARAVVSHFAELTVFFMRTYNRYLVSFSNFVIILINWQQDFMSFNSVCNHDRTPASRSSDIVNHSYDYRQNWTPLGPITNIN